MDTWVNEKPKEVLLTGQMVSCMLITSVLTTQLQFSLKKRSLLEQMKLHCHNIYLDTRSFLNSLWERRQEVLKAERRRRIKGLCVYLLSDVNVG